MSSNQQVVCPKCQRSDNIQKVTAIVTQGTKVIVERGGIDIDTNYGMDVIPLTYSSVARSNLARKLAAPEKPLQTRSHSCVAALFITRLGVTLVVSVILVALFFCSFPFLAATYAQNNALFIGILIAGFGIIGLLLLSSIRAGWRQARSTSEQRNFYDARVQAWEDSYERWQQLYYCFRDDGVFLPGQSSFVPVNQMSDYLKAETKHKRSL
jgi:hypothetical protein